MSYLRLFVCDCLRIVVSNTYCVVFLFFFFFLLLCLVYAMLPVSLDCPRWLPFRYSLAFIYKWHISPTSLSSMFKHAHSKSENTKRRGEGEGVPWWLSFHRSRNIPKDNSKFQIFWLWAHLMKVIPETRRAH
jgi:hypothetical protein